MFSVGLSDNIWQFVSLANISLSFVFPAHRPHWENILFYNDQSLTSHEPLGRIRDIKDTLALVFWIENFKRKAVLTSFAAGKYLCKVNNNGNKKVWMFRVWIVFTQSDSQKQWFWKAILKNFAKAIVAESFFNRFAGCRPAASLKKRLWRRCFNVNFAKLSRTAIFPEHLRVTTFA